MDPFAELERLQTAILRRISALELSNSSDHGANSNGGGGGCDAMESRLSALLRSMGVTEFKFRRVLWDYYDKTLEERREILCAPSVHHLCKSIVMVNTQAPDNVTDCKDRNYSKYYVVVIQYMARLNAENIKNFLYALNNQKISKKRFNMRLAPEEESLKLTGFVHNAVTCVGMKTDIPVILDEAITKLQPDFFWIGGGEVDLKLGIRTCEFISAINPFLGTVRIHHGSMENTALKYFVELCFLLTRYKLAQDSCSSTRKKLERDSCRPTVLAQGASLWRIQKGVLKRAPHPLCDAICMHTINC